MHLNALILTVAAPAFVTAQDLATVLSGQASLSSLVTLLGQVQNTTNFLASQENVTLFAPNNAALETLIVNNGSFTLGEAVVEDPGVIEQLLRYHLYRGVVRAADITEIPQFVTSYLNISGIVPDGDVSGSNVTGGQVASVGLDEEGNAVVTTGVKTTSQVVFADLEFDNGIIHIVNDLLTIPLSLPETLVLGNFTALAGAAIQTDLVPTLESLSDITVFCPNNDAFQRLAASGANTTITNDQLASILQYHIVPGTIGYSTSLTNNSALPTMNGEELSITISADGAVFANSARVINADILIENGVLHVIDEVLNPATSDSEPEDNSADNTVSLPMNVPFTSEVPPETSTIFRQLTQTTSLVAAALVTGTPNRTASTSVGSSNTSRSRRADYEC